MKSKFLSATASLLLLTILMLPANAASVDVADPKAMLPVDIIIDQDNKEIRKVYDISPSTDPSTLPMDQFERDGLRYLREHPPEGHSMEYADCRLSLLSAQKGKCVVSGEWFLQPDSIVCHMKVPKEQGGQERYSNLVLLHRRYLPLLTDQDAAALKSICKQLTVTRKQLTKINNLRTAAKLAAI